MGQTLPLLPVVEVATRPWVNRVLEPALDKLPINTIETGAIWQKHFFWEFGFEHAVDMNGDEAETDGLVWAYKLAYAYDPFDKNKTGAPELSTELNVAFATVRMSTICFLNRTDGVTHADLRFVPEVGLTFAGIVTFCYGWNIPLLKTRIPGIDAHRWTINLNFVLPDF